MTDAPTPPDPREATERMLSDLLGDRGRQAEGAFEQTAAEVQHAMVERFPADPSADGLHQVWVRPDGAEEWQHLGYASGPIVGLDYGTSDPEPVVAWPFQYGKQAALNGGLTFEHVSPYSDTLHSAFEPLFAAARAATGRRVARLAADLGLFPETARRLFDLVQQVLEDAGVGDGYGRLTLSQPVRPPVEAPPVPGLFVVRPDPFDPEYWAAPGTTLPLTMQSVPRAGP